jgi:hypothetical protein
VWPLERRVDVVRVGRRRVEYWASTAQGLVLRGEQRLELTGTPRAAELAPVLRSLLTDARGATAGGKSVARSIDVVFESAWLPVMLVEVGKSLRSSKTIEALLRHRFAQQFSEQNEAVSGWDLQIDHRPGDTRALGFGLAPATQQTVIDAAAAARLRLASLQPALAWGWQRLQADRRRTAATAVTANRGGWWIWIEQDRSLVGHVDASGRLDALNPGAAVAEDEVQCLRLMQIEALRQGLPSDDVCGVAVDWRLAQCGPSRGAGSRLQWLSLAATDAKASMAGIAPVHAGAGA